jgi:hypothetical protein
MVGMLSFNYSCTNQGQNATPGEVAETDTKEETAPEASPTDIINHHLTAFMENNIVEIMADYGETSSVITPDSTYTGLASIEAFFTGLLPSFPTEGTTINMDRMYSIDNLVYIVWNGGSPTLDVPLGTDTFIIEEGKIEYQTFAGYIVPKEAE